MVPSWHSLLNLKAISLQLQGKSAPLCGWYFWLRLVRYARKEQPDIHIIARAHDRVHVYQLYQAGADQIVREMFETGELMELMNTRGIDVRPSEGVA